MPRPDSYDSLSEAITNLQKRGFTLDFNLLENGVADANTGRYLSPDDFQIVEFYRFEGQSDPADMSIVYAIESHDGHKGVLVNAYGTYSNRLSSKLVEKLSVAHPQTPVGYEQPHPDADSGDIAGAPDHPDKYQPEQHAQFGTDDAERPAGGNRPEEVPEGRR